MDMGEYVPGGYERKVPELCCVILINNLSLIVSTTSAIHGHFYGRKGDPVIFPANAGNRISNRYLFAMELVTIKNLRKLFHLKTAKNLWYHAFLNTTILEAPFLNMRHRHKRHAESISCSMLASISEQF